MKRFLTLLLALILCIGVVCVVGCGTTPEQPTHTHEYESDWTYDETHHYKKCKGQGCDSVAEKATHDFADGKCTVCNFEVDYEQVTPSTIFDTLKNSNKKKFKLLEGSYNTVYVTDKEDITLFSDGTAKITKIMYLTGECSNITLDGLTFESEASSSGVHVLGNVDGLTFEGCTFTGDAQIRVTDEENHVQNLVINDCDFVEISGTTLSAMVIQKLTNVTITNCTFEKVQYNAMQLGAVFLKGSVIITGNTFKDVNNRILYFVGPQGEITWDISGNYFYECGSGKSDGNYLKINDSEITFGVNYWEVLPDFDDIYYFVRTIQTEQGEQLITAGIHIDEDEQLIIE